MRILSDTKPVSWRANQILSIHYKSIGYADEMAKYLVGKGYENVRIIPMSNQYGEPYTIDDDTVRALAREVADSIISDARTLHGPVVWITGNNFMPPLRAIDAAERVWQAENNDDGELFAGFTDLLESHLSAASVLLECPEYDNALYAVDLQRWQLREEPDGDDLNGEWEPVDTGDGIGWNDHLEK